MIVKSGHRICGTGAALSNAPLVQDKSFFEVKVQSGGQQEGGRKGGMGGGGGDGWMGGRGEGGREREGEGGRTFITI